MMAATLLMGTLDEFSRRFAPDYRSAASPYEQRRYDRTAHFAVPRYKSGAAAMKRYCAVAETSVERRAAHVISSLINAIRRDAASGALLAPIFTALMPFVNIVYAKRWLTIARSRLPTSCTPVDCLSPHAPGTPLGDVSLLDDSYFGLFRRYWPRAARPAARMGARRPYRDRRRIARRVDARHIGKRPLAVSLRRCGV